MTPALIPAKSLKTTCDSRLVEWQNTAVFSLDFLIPTTCPSKKLKFRPPMEKPRPALRGGVAGRGTRKRPPAFILHIFRPPGSRRHKLRIIRLAANGKAHSAAPPLQTATASQGCGLVQGAAWYLPNTSGATRRRTGCHAECSLSLRSASACATR